jgi:hypothetical protein
VIDCRARRPRTAGNDCSASRSGKVYLQYWFYYPGSATGEGSTPLKGPIRTVSRAIGKPTYHPDDWESYMVRIGPEGKFERASSHHGFGDGWRPRMGVLNIAGGSHAGRPGKHLLGGALRRVSRSTKDHRLRLVPIESIPGFGGTSFAITPPWRKRVYRDPEYAGTD